MIATIVAIGVAEFVLAGQGWISLALCAASTAAVVPWALVVLRRERPPPTSTASERARRSVAFHLANLLLVIAFLGAKWLALLEVLWRDAAYLGSYRTYTALLLLLLVLGMGLRGGRAARLVAASADHPARLMAVSFGLTSVLGALLLALPVSIRHVSDVSLLDSLFMSVSAVCVTGLATVNVAQTYTLTGQIGLCVLMQVGGLGIMALTAAVTMLAGRRLGVKSSAVMAEMVDARSLADLKRTLAIIVLYTLVFEAVGAGMLYAQFASLPDIAADDGPYSGAGSAIFAAIFHSISAFCNASLSNFRDGVMPFSGSFAVCQTLSLLIILGGLGFPVIHELIFRSWARLRGRPSPRLTLNTRIALVTSALLLGTMAIAYLVLESSVSFASLGLLDRINAALFQSACARTSGFNLVDVAAMRPATLLLTCFAMFVGGDPGSTAGGIKTTTVAVLFAAYRGELRGQRPRLYDRTIPDAVVRRAMGVAFLSTAIVVAVVFLLVLVEKHDALALTFEAVSAFSTTGLSTGITPKLSVFGKLVLVGTMLAGRVGPLTLALALSTRARLPTYELPEERVMIG